MLSTGPPIASPVPQTREQIRGPQGGPTREQIDAPEQAFKWGA